MTVFYFKTKHIDDTEIFEISGLIFAKNYSKAAKKLEAMSTNKDGKCDLIGIEELYEIENMDGVVDGYDIKELFMEGDK